MERLFLLQSKILWDLRKEGCRVGLYEEVVLEVRQVGRTLGNY